MARSEALLLARVFHIFGFWCNCPHPSAAIFPLYSIRRSKPSGLYSVGVSITNCLADGIVCMVRYCDRQTEGVSEFAEQFVNNGKQYLTSFGDRSHVSLSVLFIYRHQCLGCLAFAWQPNVVRANVLIQYEEFDCIRPDTNNMVIKSN